MVTKAKKKHVQKIITRNHLSRLYVRDAVRTPLVTKVQYFNNATAEVVVALCFTFFSKKNSGIFFAQTFVWNVIKYNIHKRNYRENFSPQNKCFTICNQAELFNHATRKGASNFPQQQAPNIIADPISCKYQYVRKVSL